METGTNLPSCPQCGAVLSPGAAQGMCPRCLMAVAVMPTQPSISRADPLTNEQVAAAFPHLHVLELIGQGGMGSVFKVRQSKLDRFAALKLLPHLLAGDLAFAGRFEREARLLARLNHPNIVAVYDYGQAGNFFYLLMEFVDGVNLRQAMRASRFEPRQALGIVPKICEALQYAHDEGVLHRDIKPENILLDTRGRVKLVDFGIAKLTAEVDPGVTDLPATDPAFTRAGVALGTPSYMAPEQRDHPSDVDHRADIYSLGVVFYELLTGELPKGSVIRPSEKSGADPRVDAIVQQALQKERDRRQHSAGEVRTQVETLSNEDAVAAGVGLPAGKIPGKAGIVRMVEIFFDINFTSLLAIRLIQVSALAFLAFLGFVPLPGMQGCFGFSGFSGLIGIAFMVEFMHRQRSAAVKRRPPVSASQCNDRQNARAIVAMSLACISGILGRIAWFLMPSPPQSIVWGILAAAVLAVVLANPVRRTLMGKSALIVGSINIAVWLMIFVIFAVMDAYRPSTPATTNAVTPATNPVVATGGFDHRTSSKQSAIETRLRIQIDRHLQDITDDPHNGRFLYDSLTVRVSQDSDSATSTLKNFRWVAAGWSAQNPDVYGQIAAVDRAMGRLIQDRAQTEQVLVDLRARVGVKNPVYVLAQRRLSDAEERIAEYARRYLAQHQDHIPYPQPIPAVADINLTYLSGGDWNVTGAGALAGMRFDVDTADIMGTNTTAATTAPAS